MCVPYLVFLSAEILSYSFLIIKFSYLNEPVLSFGEQMPFASTSWHSHVMSVFSIPAASWQRKCRQRWKHKANVTKSFPLSHFYFLIPSKLTPEELHYIQECGYFEGAYGALVG